MGRDPLDIQLLQRSSNLRQLLWGSIAMVNRSRGGVKQAGFVGVDRHRTSVLLQVAT